MDKSSFIISSSDFGRIETVENGLSRRSSFPERIKAYRYLFPMLSCQKGILGTMRLAICIFKNEIMSCLRCSQQHPDTSYTNTSDEFEAWSSVMDGVQVRPQ